MPDLCQKIIENHHLYKRDFAWRHTKDPYKIMVAEFMLHRTKAAQVASVYTKFLNCYPNAISLSNANINDVEKIIHSLGLHWRSAHFIESCKFIQHKYNGKYPQNRKDLLKIPGIGDYVAGAILIVCFKKSVYVVDSNIARFVNRFYGLKLTGEIRRNKIIIDVVRNLFRCENPDELFFSILDFTALVCKPHIPNCNECCININCRHFTSAESKSCK